MSRPSPSPALGVLLLLALATGCAKANWPYEPPGGSGGSPSGSARAVARAVNGMGLDLYAKLRATGGNLVFSPASIGFALGMVYGGAAGDTKADMARTMHLTDVHPDAVHPGFSGLIARASEYGDGAKLRIANRIWAAEGMGLADRFLALTRDEYGAEAENANFGDAEVVRQRINGWVAEMTNDRIQDLLPPGSIGGATVMVLANAIWFKGTWTHQFNPKDTEDRAFRLLDGKQVYVPIMGHRAPARLAQLDGVRLLELDYADSDLAMVVALGDTPGGLADLEAKLTPANLATWLDALEDLPEVDVWLPRFQATKRAPLKELLMQVGLERLFTPAADLSPMLESGRRGLYATDAFHKAFVAVNEEGAEAAAATAIVIGESATIGPKIPEFRADRPFLWMIRDKQTGLILFLGRVVDPR
jgi:serine protease inhibitor